MNIANRFDLPVVEDAAQALLAEYKGRHAGTLGHLGTISFHQTKNVTCGEGGALLINDSRFIGTAEVIWEKGTNKLDYDRGNVERYSWVGLGSSCLPSEITAAVLYAQLGQARQTTAARVKLWNRYLERLAAAGLTCLPVPPPESVQHNGHIFHVMADTQAHADQVIRAMAAQRIGVSRHYTPLHQSPAGQKYGRMPFSPLDATEDASARLLRLPLWPQLTDEDQDSVVTALIAAFMHGRSV